MEDESKELVEKKDLTEEALSILLSNGEALLSIARVVDRLAKAGIPQLIEKIAENSMPSDPDTFLEPLKRSDMVYDLSKGLNILPALMHAISDETGSDAIKSVLYDSDILFDEMVSGAKSPNRFTLMRLLAILKDEEVAAGLTSLINAIKFLGRAFRRVGPE
ncbi:MAG: DUF1641 domain-containing protein [Candidatus Thermoplasmatota archaeon]|nr:DUF1641 domain-containing protein [Candidatus Thermoplasmatota archaeon]